MRTNVKRYIVLLLLFIFCVVPFASPVLAEQGIPVYYAADILEDIREGRDVSIDGGIIEGDLDFTQLDYGAPPNVSRVVRFQSQIHIVDSEVRGNVIAYMVNPSTKIIFEKKLNFTGTEILGWSSFYIAEFSSEACFSETRFKGDTYFYWTQFSEKVDFEAAEFHGYAGFYMTQFYGFANFDGTQFSEEADFEAAEFHANAGFRWTQFSEKVDFKASKFHGYTLFRETIFSGDTYFSLAQFSGDTYFYEARFSLKADFEVAEFHANACFRWTQFYGFANFDGTKFFGEADFFMTQFSEEADFNAAEFHTSTDFRWTQFSKWASFTNAQFFSLIDFRNAQFSERADFTSARFSGIIYFTQTQFSERVMFIGTEFLKPVFFSDVHFYKTVHFIESTFYDESDFSRAEFKEISSFIRANFSGFARFDSTIFHSMTEFRDTNFQIVSFSGLPAAIFRDVADFRRTKIDSAFLIGTRFSQVDFSGASFETGLYLEDTVYSSMILDWKEVAHLIVPKDDPEVFRSLEENFRNQKRLDYANGAYFRCKIAERKMKSPLMQYLEMIFLDWTCGYGVRPQNVVIISLVLILLFTCAYLPPGTTIRSLPTEKQRLLTLRLRELPLASSQQERQMHEVIKELSQHGRFRQALGFSITVFTKIGFGDIYGTNRVRWLLIIEWFIGIVMISLLFYTLSNTVPIIQALLTGIL